VDDESKKYGAVVSTLDAELELDDLVAEFVEELPKRLAAIEQALADANLNALKRLTHQLKGSAGGFGFAPITQAAKRVEQQATSGADIESLRTSLDELATLVRRVSVKPDDER
jgi:HPt (histidine-containing phosphotransfer) domain-containing protein